MKICIIILTWEITLIAENHLNETTFQYQQMLQMQQNLDFSVSVTIIKNNLETWINTLVLTISQNFSQTTMVHKTYFQKNTKCCKKLNQKMLWSWSRITSDNDTCRWQVHSRLYREEDKNNKTYMIPKTTFTVIFKCKKDQCDSQWKNLKIKTYIISKIRHII